MCNKNNNRERIGSKLRQIRESKGISQLRLAELAGVNRITVLKIEGGKFNPSLDLINRLAAPLGARLELVEGEKRACEP